MTAQQISSSGDGQIGWFNFMCGYSQQDDLMARVLNSCPQDMSSDLAHC